MFRVIGISNLAVNKPTFVREVLSLWDRDPIPFDASLSDMNEIVIGYWSLAKIAGYSSLSIQVNSTPFLSYSSEMESGDRSSSDLLVIGRTLESLFRKLPANTVFNSSDSSIVFKSIKPKVGSIAVIDRLASSLFYVFGTGLSEGTPNYRNVLSLIADFFLAWEVVLNDGGTEVVAAVI